MSTVTENPTQQPVAEAERPRRDVFKYSTYVHVQPGAEGCPLALWLDDPEHTGSMPKCADPAIHFHAYVRLPNPYQVRDIQEKARAARARRIRSLRDPESDAYAILEGELEALNDPMVRELMIDEIIDVDFREDHDAALRYVMDLDDEGFVPKDEDEETPKLYADIIQDQEEYARQIQLPEDQRDEDFPELQKTVGAFSEAVNSELESIQGRRREGLDQNDTADLIKFVRDARIAQSGQEAFLHTYNTWAYFVCTFKPKATGTPNERMFKDIGTFKFETPPEVIGAIQVAMNDLEMRLAGERAKNF